MEVVPNGDRTKEINAFCGFSSDILMLTLVVHTVATMFEGVKVTLLLKLYFVWCYKQINNIYFKADSRKKQKLSNRFLGGVTGHRIMIHIFDTIALLKSAQFVFISGNVTSLFTFKQKNVFPALSCL
jgi:hypothetical protein